MTGRYPQFRTYGKGRGGGFKTKQEGHNMRRSIWICQTPLCHRWHDEGKPRQCRACAGEAFWYMASKKQAERAANLLMQQRMGYIRNLQFEVPLEHTVNGVKCFTYRADAVYVRASDGRMVYEDTKSKADPKAWDPVFKLKKRCIEAQYGIEITISTGG